MSKDMRLHHTQQEHTHSVPTATLTAADRCDQCGVRAITRRRRGTDDLLFCLHHDKINAEALTKAGYSLNVDDRPTLVKS